MLNFTWKKANIKFESNILYINEKFEDINKLVGQLDNKDAVNQVQTDIDLVKLSISAVTDELSGLNTRISKINENLLVTASQDSVSQMQKVLMFYQ